MNSLQKTFKTFIESTCAQYGCPEMAAPLQEGFSALCKESSRNPVTMVESVQIEDGPGENGKIRVVYNGIPLEVGVDDLLQGLLCIYAHNGSFWCFDQLGFDFENIRRHAPGSRGDPDKIIQGLGEDVVRQALQKVIDNPNEYGEFLDWVIPFTKAVDNAVANRLKTTAETEAEALRNNGYAVEVAVGEHGLPVTLYFAKKSNNPSCFGSGVKDSEVGGYVSSMRMFLMDCDAGFKVYSRNGSSYPVNLKACAQRLSKELGALTISDFRQVDSNYTVAGADWHIIGSGKYGRQAVSYKLRLIRGLTAYEFYHNTPLNA